jgi:hypothetical protein
MAGNTADTSAASPGTAHTTAQASAASPGFAHTTAETSAASPGFAHTTAETTAPPPARHGCRFEKSGSESSLLIESKKKHACPYGVRHAEFQPIGNWEAHTHPRLSIIGVMEILSM